MKNLYLKILFVSLLFSIIGCNVDDDDGTNSVLPEITSEGAQTFGCKINGQIFVPRNGRSCIDCSPTTKLRLSYSRKGDDQYKLSITANNNINGDVSISLDLYLDEPLEERLYELSESYIISIDKELPNASSCIYREINGEEFNSCFVTNSDITGTLEIIEINESEKFISGIFDFKGVNQQGQVVDITSGRFDVIIYYSNVF
ncbi:DUF6252 family protein [Gillisia hiemivivida]|uniref:Uncharacterized protein n=1 Tax=Gillisia hiemivivida TaxID=291190 RepID=A0A5C6ZQS2_9FLAO|nr:DUF6252 family protein [Gillisia hiemivivida]TXD92016.1 hypothetical protein ES724_15130 [Gillisia hiemivivida]